jgi:elongation factor P hydroxylase
MFGRTCMHRQLRLVNGEEKLFWPEMNIATILGDEQPIKLCEKHYPPPEYIIYAKSIYLTEMTGYGNLI